MKQEHTPVPFADKKHDKKTDQPYDLFGSCG